MEHLSKQRDFKADAVLAAAARDGNREAFEELAAGYRAYVGALVSGRVPESEKDDLVQDIIARAWHKIVTLNDPLAFAAWLKTLALNICRSHNRRAARRDSRAEIEPESIAAAGADPLDSVLRREMTSKLRDALAGLPADNRRPLIMHVWNCYAYSEIAAKLGLPVTTVVGRIHRAKAQLRRLLGVPEPPRQVRRKGHAMQPDDFTLIPQIGHSDGVKLIALSPDGKRMASAGASTVIVWNLETGEQELRTGSVGFADALCFSPDSSLLAISGYGGRTLVWDVERGAVVADMQAHSRPMLFSEDSRALWGAMWSPDPDSEHWVQSSVVCWDLSTRKITNRIENMAGAPKAMSGDASKLVTIDGVAEYDANVFIRLSDVTLIIWDLPEGREILRLKGLKGLPLHLVVDPEFRYLAASSRGPDTPNDVLVWDLTSGELLHTLTGQKSMVSSLAFSPDSSELVVTDFSGRISVWDPASGNEFRRFEKSGWLQAAAYSVDGKHIITSAPDAHSILMGSGGIVIWDAQDGSMLKAFDERITLLMGMAFSQDGTELAAGSLTSRADIWHTRPGSRAARIDLLPGEFVFRPAFHPDDDRIVLSVNRVEDGRQTGSIEVRDRRSRALLRKLSGHTSFVYQISFSPDGTRAASSSLDGSIIVWDSDWQIERHLHYPDGWMSGKCVVFSPDGTSLAANSLEVSPNGAIVRGELAIWSMATGEVVRRWVEECGGFEDFAFSPDGTMIAAGMGSVKPDQTHVSDVRILEVGSGAELRRFSAPGVERIVSVILSPDGSTLAVRAVDGRIVIWDVRTGKLVNSIQRDSGVGSIAISPDGRQMASAGVDGLIRLWDFAAVAAGQADREQIALAALTDGNWLAYTPDGHYSCSPGAEKYLLWRKGSKLLRAEDCPEMRIRA